MGRPKKETPNRSGGLYEVKVTVGKTWDGKPIRKSFYSSVSKDAARAKAQQYKIDQAVADATGSTFIRNDSYTFESWAHKVLQTIKGTVKDSSYNLTYRNSIEKHLIPYFFHAKIDNIKQIDIQSYFNVKGRELSYETLKKHKMALNRIFESAVLNDLCAKNPCTSIKIKSAIPQIKKHTYTKEQCDLVLSYAKTHRFGLGVYLMLQYGISRSELLGLRWDDIDLDGLTMKIERGVSDVQNSVTGKMEVVVGDTKNEFRRREIPISSDTACFLRKMQNGSDYVICNSSCNVCSPRTWNRRHYDVFMRDMHDHYQSDGIDVPILSAHELRHTRASIWVNDGENIFAVADVLGHSDLKMLRKRYAHSDVESTRKLLKID